MDAPQRKYIVGANLESSCSVLSVMELVSNVMNKLDFSTEKLEVFVAPSTLHIASIKALLNRNVTVAAQNMSKTGNGAFTGEVSGEQLFDFEVKTVILGCAERRDNFQETNDVIAAKVAKAQSLGLLAVVCVGEDSNQRE